MNGLRQLRDATGGHQVGWKSSTQTTTRRQVSSNAANKVRQVSRCSAVQNSVYKDRQFEIDALRSTKPVKTGKSVSGVILAT